jgi:sulfonate transport system substrate-binding protein
MRDLLHLAQHAEEVLPSQLPDLRLGVATSEQLARDVGRLADVREAGDIAAVVEIGAEPDMIDANEPDRIVDGIDVVGERGIAPGVPRPLAATRCRSAATALFRLLDYTSAIADDCSVTRPVVLLCLLASAACSNDAASKTPSPQTTDSWPSRANEGGTGAPAVNASDLKELRIGYQKSGVLVIARQQAVLESRLAPLGIHMTWVEFSSGPPLLEAMSAGSIDLGYTGDAPPIFAQAGGAHIVYVAGQPSTNGQAILVQAGSDIHTLGDLKGKRVGFTRGSSAHNLVVLALDQAGLSYSDITPVYLSPPDAGAAFARGSIDAWAIWDPFYAIGQQRGGRVLAEGSALGKTNSFFLANREFAARHAGVLGAVIAGLGDTARWAESHRDRVASALAEVTGVDLAIQTVAANRATFAIGTLSDDLIATQQAVADRFHRLGLIPKPVAIREAVWLPPSM